MSQPNLRSKFTRPLTAIMTALCAVTAVNAQEPIRTSLSDSSYLRKLSYHLRGRNATPEEYSQLKALTPVEREKYLQTQIDSYLQTPEFANHLSARVIENLGVALKPLPKTTVVQLAIDNPKMQIGARSFNPAEQDPLSVLVHEITSQNQTWDTLLTGKRYSLFKERPSEDADRALNSEDYEFYGSLKPELKADSLKRTGIESLKLNDDSSRQNVLKGAELLARLRSIGEVIEFTSNDARIAGVITTPRFMSRYTATNVNRNRRRAAALYRLFLCDSMVPVIPPLADKKTPFLANTFEKDATAAQTNLAFQNLHSGVTEAQLGHILKLNAEDRHGNDQRCAACHYKLDPAGQTFQSTGNNMTAKASPGHLRFNRGDVLVDIPTAGLGELAHAISQQPEYVHCQVQWFWQQYIGKDVPLKASVQQELAQAFDRVGRKPKDFLRILVQRPEFRQAPERSDVVSFDRVRPLLQRCDTCHSNRREQIPELATGQKLQRDLVREIKYRVEAESWDVMKMPQDWKHWDPADLKLIRKWIEQQAAEVSP